MRLGDGSTARSRAVLALYLVCTLLVFSFILFEVLDVDASDFPPPSKATTSIKLAEPPHDLKRTMTSTVEGPLAPHSCASASERRQTPLSLRSPLAPPHARACRTTLPRAVLPDAAPAV